MELEKDVIQIIDEKYPKMSKSHKAIARFIKEDYDQAVFMTAAKIGENDFSVGGNDLCKKRVFQRRTR